MKLDNWFKQDEKNGKSLTSLEKNGKKSEKFWEKWGKSLKSFEKNGKKSDKIWEKCEQDDEQKLQSLTVKTNFKKQEK